MSDKPYFVYAIKSLTAKYIYVGITDHVERRFGQHSKGWNRSTKHYRPFVLLLVEEFETRAAARSREIYLKSGVGKEYLKSL